MYYIAEVFKILLLDHIEHQVIDCTKDYCQRVSGYCLNKGQYRVRLWLGADKQRAIGWAIDQRLHYISEVSI